MIELWVPGRIEFLGKHTDYAGGRSLLCAIDRGIRLSSTARNDDVVRVRDARLGESVECRLDPNLDRPRGHWANYPFTVARRIARDFPNARRGADIVFESDLPSAAGMSSSAALIVGIYLALADSNDLDDLESNEDLAEYAGCIENGAPFRRFAGDDGVGILNGCQDQAAILCARPGELVQYAFSPLRFESAVPIPRGHSFVIAASGVVAEKTGAALERYNALSERARAVLASWNTLSGSDDRTLGDAIARVGASTVREAISARDPASLVDRFDQFQLESNGLIPAAAAALRRNDSTGLSDLGSIVDRSQDAAERFLGNQVPETIDLARSARELGAVAASAFGAGFGGSVWALMADVSAPAFLSDGGPTTSPPTRNIAARHTSL